MGIHGLLPFISDPKTGAIKAAHIREFKGKTAAVDGYVLLHRGIYPCAKELFMGQHTDAFVVHCMKYMELLHKYGVKPIVVFDGANLGAKRETEKERRDEREKQRRKALDLQAMGKTDEARQAMVRAVNVTHQMAHQLIVACRARNIDSIVAPYEADAQLAHLSSTGLVDLVITEDSDLIVFGCQHVLFKLSLTGEGMYYNKALLENALSNKKVRCNNWSFDKFRIACILSGCDYVKSLPGIGLIKAWHFACMTDSLDDLDHKLPKMAVYLNLRANVKVTDEYIREVKLANGAFKHQVVYDPVTRERKTLQPCHPDDGNCAVIQETIGTIQMSANESLDKALGNVDPQSGAILDNFRPTPSNVLAKSIWSTSRPPFEKRVVKPTLMSKVVPMATPRVMTTDELDCQDNELTAKLQRYVNQDSDKCKSAKECFYEDLYGEKEEDLVCKKEIDKSILAKNPFIKKKLATKVIIEDTEKVMIENTENTHEEVSDKISPVLKKSIKSREKCTFKQRRNIDYDKLIVDKRKAVESSVYFTVKKAKTDELVTDVTIVQTIENDLIKSDLAIVETKHIPSGVDLEETKDVPIVETIDKPVKLDLLKTIDVPIEVDSESFVVVVDTFEDQVVSNNMLEKENVNILNAVENDYLKVRPLHEMLECVLNTSEDDPELDLNVNKNETKPKATPIAKFRNIKREKGKRQTKMFDFFTRK